jgi:hypothetical protein
MLGIWKGNWHEKYVRQNAWSLERKLPCNFPVRQQALSLEKKTALK